MSLASAAAELSLTEALDRMEQEATRGVADLGRYQARYVTWGEGPPLVFIHGLGDNLHSFVLPMALLSSEYRCIAYNQPCGRGDGGRLRGYRHGDLVDDLYRLLDRLHVCQPSLVGHSYGSTIAVQALHGQPDRFSRSVLIGGFARRPLFPIEWHLAVGGRILPGRLKYLPFRKVVLHKMHHELFADLDPDLWAYFLEQSDGYPIRAMAHWALQIHGTDVRPLVPQIRQPVLLVCGDSDPLVPHEHQEYLFRHLPAAVMFQIYRCGHFPTLTHPRAIADAIRRFLNAPACAFSANGRR